MAATCLGKKARDGLRPFLLSLFALIAPSGSAISASDWENCKAFGMPDPRIGCTEVVNKSNPKIALSRASTFRGGGPNDEAFANNNEAIGRDPRRTAYNQGLIKAAAGDPDGALVDFDEAIRQDPGFALAYNARGTLYRGKGDGDRAMADFDRALELDPKLAVAHTNRANLLSDRGEIDRAIADYSQAIEIDPKFGLAFTNRGRAYEKKNDRGHAIADYRAVVDLPVASVTDKQRQEIARHRIARVTESLRGLALPPPVERVALVIGNSNYPSVGLLPNPKTDARAMAAALHRLGFTDVMEGYDMTHEQMGRAIRDFGDRAEGAEWAVIFFAGHAMELGGVNYLIPTDAKLRRDTHVLDETISLTSLQTKVDGAAKIGLVILDSCRDNPFLSRMVRSGKPGTDRSIDRGLADIEPEGNMLVVYSAKHGTTAEDGTGEHSPFTEALLDHIEEPGLDLSSLFRKVRDDVWAKTQKEPFLYGSPSSERLYFKGVTR
jgi:tetratricopeptide (TPR) repeat protein